MFQLAYPSCKAIGSVLLQTAPARGLSAGRIESFLRAMREVRYLCLDERLFLNLAFCPLHSTD